MSQIRDFRDIISLENLRQEQRQRERVTTKYIYIHPWKKKVRKHIIDGYQWPLVGRPYCSYKYWLGEPEKDPGNKRGGSASQRRVNNLRGRCKRQGNVHLCNYQLPTPTALAGTSNCLDAVRRTWGCVCVCVWEWVLVCVCACVRECVYVWVSVSGCPKCVCVYTPPKSTLV